MVCRCSQMRWGSSFLKDTESWTKDDQSIPVPGTVWTVWLPTKCGTGSKDCSKVRLKCWMVLGYTFYKTRLYMNVVSQNLYMPSVFKSCLRKLTSFPLFPSLHGDDGHVTATAEPLHGPSFREACCRHFVQSLEPSASSERRVWQAFNHHRQNTEKWLTMVILHDFTRFTAKLFLMNKPKQFAMLSHSCLMLPHVASSFVSRVAVRSWSWKDMKSFICRAPFFRRVLEIGQCCPELNVNFWRMTSADFVWCRQMFFWDVHTAVPYISIHFLELDWKVVTGRTSQCI